MITISLDSGEASVVLKALGHFATMQPRGPVPRPEVFIDGPIEMAGAIVQELCQQVTDKIQQQQRSYSNTDGTGRDT